MNFTWSLYRVFTVELDSWFLWVGSYLECTYMHDMHMSAIKL